MTTNKIDWQTLPQASGDYLTPEPGTWYEGVVDVVELDGRMRYVMTFDDGAAQVLPDWAALSRQLADLIAACGAGVRVRFRHEGELKTKSGRTMYRVVVQVPPDVLEKYRAAAKREPAPF